MIGMNHIVSRGALHKVSKSKSASEPLQHSSETNCFACGTENPYGLGIHYRITEAGVAEAYWTPLSHWQSFNDVIHGGIVTTVMDEAMAKAIVASGQRGLTCEMRVRLHDSLRPGVSVAIRGWIVTRHRRLIKTEANICSSSGRELAHAWASFLIAAAT